MASPKSFAGKWSVFRAILLFLVLAEIMLASFAWIAHMPFSQVWALPVGQLVVAALFVRSSSIVPEAVPEPAQTLLREALDREGLSKVRLAYGASGAIAEFPRPLCVGSQLTLSKRLVHDISLDALVWTAKGTALSHLRLNRFAGWIFLFFIAIFLSFAFAQRWQASSLWLAGLAFLTLLMLVCWGALEDAIQIQVDREITRTADDRSAAKEALSYAYFAQLDRKLLKKWMFFRSALYRRAERLGISLEREFQCIERRAQ